MNLRAKKAIMEVFYSSISKSSLTNRQFDA